MFHFLYTKSSYHSLIICNYMIAKNTFSKLEDMCSMMFPSAFYDSFCVPLAIRENILQLYTNRKSCRMERTLLSKKKC